MYVSVHELLLNGSFDLDETFRGCWPRGQLQNKLLLTSIRGRLTSEAAKKYTIQYSVMHLGHTTKLVKYF